VDEYRVAYLEESTPYIERNLDVPTTQALFVLAFSESTSFSDVDLAIKHAQEIAKKQDLDQTRDIGFLDYDYWDWSSFMDKNFAERLLYGKKNKNNKRRNGQL
jgi:hypothetical protein